MSILSIRIFKKWTSVSLVARIVIGLVIGALLGLTVPQWTFFTMLGQVFVSALKAIAPVLVAVLITASIAKAGEGLGGRFRVVILYYMFSTFVAAVCAVVGSFLFPVTLQLKDAADAAAPSALTDVFSNLLTNMVSNPLLSVSGANYVGILFWAVIAGFALKLKASATTIGVVSDLAEVISMGLIMANLVIVWVSQLMKKAKRLLSKTYD